MLTHSLDPENAGNLTRKSSLKVRMLNKPCSGTSGVLREGVVLNTAEVDRGQPVGDLAKMLNIIASYYLLDGVGITYHRRKVGFDSQSFGQDLM